MGKKGYHRGCGMADGHKAREMRPNNMEDRVWALLGVGIMPVA